MAPETFSISPADPGSELRGRTMDIWACGVTLFYMLRKRFPFEAKNLIDLREQTLSGTPDFEGLSNE